MIVLLPEVKKPSTRGAFEADDPVVRIASLGAASGG